MTNLTQLLQDLFDMKKILCFDLDGVICITKGNDYKNSKPNKKNIKYINNLYNKGYIIKIFTARFMTTCKGNLKQVKKKGFSLTKAQLKSWGVKYNEFIIGKHCDLL